MRAALIPNSVERGMLFGIMPYPSLIIRWAENNVIFLRPITSCSDTGTPAAHLVWCGSAEGRYPSWPRLAVVALAPSEEDDGILMRI